MKEKFKSNTFIETWYSKYSPRISCIGIIWKLARNVETQTSNYLISSLCKIPLCTLFFESHCSRTVESNMVGNCAIWLQNYCKYSQRSLLYVWELSYNVVAKSLCITGHINRMKRWTIEWKKIFRNHVSDKKLISRKDK